jgi:hypothetical protein
MCVLVSHVALKFTILKNVSPSQGMMPYHLRTTFGDENLGSKALPFIETLKHAPTSLIS